MDSKQSDTKQKTGDRRKKDVPIRGCCGCLVLFLVVNFLAWGVNVGFYALLTGELSLEKFGEQIDLSRNESVKYASERWFLPGRFFWIFPILLGIALFGSMFRNSQPNKKVFCLICERIFEPIYFLFCSILSIQVGHYCTLVVYSQIFLYLEPRLTRLVGAIAGGIVYLFFLISGICGILLLIFSLISSLKMNVKMLKIFFIFPSKLKPNYRATNSFSDLRSTVEVDLLVISDLHIPADGKSTIEPGGNQDLLKEFLSLLSENVRAKAIIVAGDATDAGADSAWEQAKQMLGELSSGVLVDNSQSETLVIPGNHDIQFARMNEPEWELKVYLRHLFFPDPDPDLPTQSSPEKESNSATKENEVVNWIERLTDGRVKEFPSLHETEVCDVLLLDSNKRLSRSPISNAIGYVGHAQLLKARELLENRTNTDKPLVFVLHHHIVPPVENLSSRWILYFLMCIDSPEIFRMASKYHAKAILHGHLHMPYVCTFPKLSSQLHSPTVVSTGSAQFRAKGPFHDKIGGPSAYGITFTSTGCQTVLFHKKALSTKEQKC